MKQTLFLILGLLLACSLGAEPSQDRLQQGKAAYDKGNYDLAIACWESLLSDSLECGEIYYNLGNAYYRTEQWGPCLLNYERARRLMPHDRDLKENLALAYSKTEDHVEDLPQLFFVRWWNQWVDHHTPRGWMNVCIVIFLLLGGCVTVFALSRDYLWRKWSLVANGILAAVWVLCMVCTLASSVRTSRADEAIVQEPVSVVQGSPDAKGVEKFVIHQGTKVYLDEQSGSWVKIHIGNGNSGWINSQDIEII